MLELGSVLVDVDARKWPSECRDSASSGASSGGSSDVGSGTGRCVGSWLLAVECLRRVMETRTRDRQVEARVERDKSRWLLLAGYGVCLGSDRHGR